MMPDARTVFAAGWESAMRAAPSWTPADEPTLVVVPHPDDESLMTGGLIARLAARGVSVTVLAVTDGGAAYRGPIAANDLEHIRRNEQRAAIETLGLAPSSVWRLGVHDGEVTGRQRDVSEIIGRLIHEHGISRVVAPWRHDFHTDHEACGRAALDGARPSGAQVVGGLFWAPRRVPRDEGPMPGLVELHLSERERAAKMAAVEQHRSQIDGLDGCGAPILSADDLAGVRVRSEFYVIES